MTESASTRTEERALDGVRVLDLTHQIAGPSTTLALAFMGADVVKIVAPGATESYDNLAFFLNNASKRSVELDLKSEHGRATLYELAAAADVCIENFGPGVAERLGITYGVLKELNPGIIFAQVKGFAEETAFGAFPAFDPVAQAYSGAISVTGSPGEAPFKPGLDLADTGTGMVLVSGILAALYQRTRTGRGQLVKISMADQIAALLRISYVWPIEQGIGTPRFGNGAPFINKVAPSNIYPCKPFGTNDYLHIHCGNDKQWRKLAVAMDRPELADDPRTATLAARGENCEFVDSVVGDWVAKRDKIEAMTLLGGQGVPAGAVRNTLEVLMDPDLRERGITFEVEHRELGTIPAVGWPVRLSDSPPAYSNPPVPGEHTDEVMREWLGRPAPDPA